MTAETQIPGDQPRFERIGWRDLLFSFRGRISRRTYVTRALLAEVLILLLLISALALLIFLIDSRANVWSFRGSVLSIVFVAVTLVWVQFATLVKRLHDRNRNGWLVLLSLIPLVNIWILIEALFLRGRNANTYGPAESSEFSGRAIVIALAISAFVVPTYVVQGLARTFILQPFDIPSGALEPTLLIGDYFFVSKSAYGYSRYSFPFGLVPFDGRFLASEPTRGDLVVFKFPPDNSTDYIKRLIGLPGDRIQMEDGVLYINDQAVPKEKVEDYVELIGEETRNVPRYRETLPNGVSYDVLDRDPQGNLDNTQVFVVPEGHYFMMGDNRDNSADSRVDVGYVPFENLVGKAEIVFFSTNGSARLWEIWKWPLSVRYDRIGRYVE